eukprot:Skav230669  [mRNA]  locus=scaffold2185:186285:188689:- [translate_table: standard]
MEELQAKLQPSPFFGLCAVVELSSDIGRKERITLARKPLGGSVVNLMPFCNTGTGKYAAGSSNSSHIFSSSGMNVLYRWQFCRSTQVPFFRASTTIVFAFGPCPCPKEITPIVEAISTS